MNQFRPGDFVRHKDLPNVVWRIITQVEPEGLLRQWQCLVVYAACDDQGRVVRAAADVTPGSKHNLLNSSLVPLTPLEVIAVAAS